MHEQMEEQKSEGTFWKESVIDTKPKFWRKEVNYMLHMQVVVLESPRVQGFLTTKFFQIWRMKEEWKSKMC